MGTSVCEVMLYMVIMPLQKLYLALCVCVLYTEKAMDSQI